MKKAIFLLVLCANIALCLWEYKAGAFLNSKVQTVATVKQIWLVSEVPIQD